MHERCCCATGTIYSLTPCHKPCMYCGENTSQPDAVVTINSSVPFCQAFSGTYTYYLYDRANDWSWCLWWWTKGWYLLEVVHYPATNIWHVTAADYSISRFVSTDQALCCDIDSGEIRGQVDVQAFASTLPSCPDAGGTVVFADGEPCRVPTIPPRCPGGAPIFTSSDLSAYVGKAIEITEDLGTCYRVDVFTGIPDVLTTVTPATWFAGCADCCDEIGGTAI